MVSLSTPVLPFFFFNLISRVSYLYIVMLMSNSCGADGRGERLAISLDFVAYYSPGAGRTKPRALWWREATGAGACLFFSRASSATYLSGPRMRPGGGRFLDSPEPPGFRSWGVSSFALLILSTPARLPSSLAPTPAHPHPPASEEAAFISFLNITFTPVWASDEKNSPSRLWVSKSLRKFTAGTLSRYFLAKIADPCRNLH